MGETFVIFWGEPGGSVRVLKSGLVACKYETRAAADRRVKQLNTAAIANDVPWRYWVGAVESGSTSGGPS